MTAARPLRTGAVLTIAIWLMGCRQFNHVQVSERIAALPAQHSVSTDHLTVLSDFRIPRDHTLVRELERLRSQISSELELPEQSETVTIYLFEDEPSYRRYLEATWPGLPPRRAYFVGTSRELAVYSFWGERIQEDLRHEYTHGILHACLKEVPLWLDEGLAEYFEVPGDPPGTVNPDYARNLATELASGWRPDIDRLEMLEDFSGMERRDYQESWSWVHFMLHESHDTRQVLLGYLADLRDDAHPRVISERLPEVLPSFEQRFLNYVASLGMRFDAAVSALHERRSTSRDDSETSLTRTRFPRLATAD